MSFLFDLQVIHVPILISIILTKRSLEIGFLLLEKVNAESQLELP